MTVLAVLRSACLHPRVHPLTGVREDTGEGGLSAADRTALELALRQGAALGAPVVALTAGPVQAEGVLREALAAGAGGAVRAEMDGEAPVAAVAAALAAALAAATRATGQPWQFAWGGDHSPDGGSGMLPPSLAAHLQARQAAGLTAVDLADPQAPVVHRRLDGGRREVLRVRAPAVLSVEAGVVAPRRPGLPGVLAAATAGVATVPAGPVPAGGAGSGGGPGWFEVPQPVRVGPFRPRARVLPGPEETLSARERLLELSGALSRAQPPRVVHAGPQEAAAELLAFLTSRGFLP